MSTALVKHFNKDCINQLILLVYSYKFNVQQNVAWDDVLPNYLKKACFSYEGMFPISRDITNTTVQFGAIRIHVSKMPLYKCNSL
ncbi:hypothetical protein C0J52_00455 [Blattella germanica]|nr:hypothetical protein C0J52_00455 [Blattella germanica]